MCCKRPFINCMASFCLDFYPPPPSPPSSPHEFGGCHHLLPSQLNGWFLTTYSTALPLTPPSTLCIDYHQTPPPLMRLCSLCMGLHLKPPKYERIFVAVITFFPFLLCKYFWFELISYCVCFKMICKKSL